jgi:hypothetical protein
LALPPATGDETAVFAVLIATPTPGRTLSARIADPAAMARQALQ